jgi:DNA-binding transcriptional LysR family regulator
MDRIQTMASLVAVVDEGGFARAARRLKVSPPVITRAIADLEQRLGLALLHRTTRVVRVTEAGARYAADCRRILADLDEADEAALGVHAAARGPLAITAPVLFGNRFVTPIVTQYLRANADTQVGCWFLDRVVNLVEEGLDVAIRIGELPDSSLQAVRVGEVRRIVCASPAYLKEHGIPRTPDSLAKHTLIAASGVTPHSDWQFRIGNATRSIKLRPRMTTTTNDAARTAALSGFGVTRLLSYQVAADIEAGHLRVVLREFEPAPLPIHVVHREGRRATGKVRAFVDLAIAQLRGDPHLRAPV